jgi:two-component sensor histidine kinase
MSSRPSVSLAETTDERTIRLLNEEVAQLHGEAGRASAREVGLAASLLSAQARLRNSGDMLHEVNHRAKNSIQIAISLLTLQMHATSSDEVRGELATAVRRLSHIAAAHVILNSQSADEQVIAFRDYLTTICTETHKALGNDDVALVVEADELALDTARAINVALIVTEALTNSIKYAFPDGRSGTIRVNCQRAGETATLSVIDDGVGFVRSPREGALGLRLIQTLAKGIGGVAEIDGHKGTRVVVRFIL